MENNETMATEATETPIESQEALQTEETLEAAPEQEAAKEAVKEEIKRNIKKLKLKVDGETIEEEVDLDDEEGLTRQLQLAKAAQKRMSEASEQRKQIEAVMNLLMNSPDKALQELGIDPEQFAVNFLQNKIEESKKSPEQLEREALQKELEELRSKVQREEEERKSAELARLQNEAEKQLEDGIMSALQSSNIPQSPLAIKKMAEIMYTALQNDINLDPKDVIPLMKREIEADIKDFIKIAPDEMVEALLGAERINNFRKRSIEALKKKKVASVNDVKTVSKEPAPVAVKEKINLDEWLYGLPQKKS